MKLDLFHWFYWSFGVSGFFFPVSSSLLGGGMLLELRNEKTELSRDRRANSIKRDQGRREKELTLALESPTARLGK